MPRRSLALRLRELAAFARDMASLGAGRRARAKLWLASLALPVKARLPGISAMPWRVRVLVGDGAHTIALADRSDFQVLEEVLLERVYDVRPPVDPGLVIDLGAHVGISVLYFHTEFPNAEILAVEPDPTTFRLLQRNVGHLPRVRLLRAAAGGAPGAGSVVRDGLSWTARVDADRAGDVEIVTLDKLTAGSPPGGDVLVKIDVEGDEWAVLAAADLRRFSMIVGELHPAAVPDGVDAFFSLFDDFDVTRPADAAGHGTFTAVRRTASAR